MKERVTHRPSKRDILQIAQDEQCQQYPTRPPRTKEEIPSIPNPVDI